MLAILKHLKNKCAIRKNKVNEIKYGKEFLNFKNINSSINKNTKWMVIHRKKKHSKHAYREKFILTKGSVIKTT